jgi:hypothetical protein
MTLTNFHLFKYYTHPLTYVSLSTLYYHNISSTSPPNQQAEFGARIYRLTKCQTLWKPNPGDVEKSISLSPPRNERPVPLCRDERRTSLS